jgi:hypothetical protein
MFSNSHLWSLECGPLAAKALLPPSHPSHSRSEVREARPAEALPPPWQRPNARRVIGTARRLSSRRTGNFARSRTFCPDAAAAAAVSPCSISPRQRAGCQCQHVIGRSARRPPSLSLTRADSPTEPWLLARLIRLQRCTHSGKRQGSGSVGKSNWAPISPSFVRMKARSHRPAGSWRVQSSIMALVKTIVAAFTSSSLIR